MALASTIAFLGMLPAAHAANDDAFDQTMPRAVLERYLSRAISMEGILHGRGDLAEHIRMLTACGAKFIGRSFCLWGGEAGLAGHLEQARQAVITVHRADPDMILQGCVFEAVTRQVEGISVPDWVFSDSGEAVESRTFRYADMLYADGRRIDQWGSGSSVPDISRAETRLWFYYLAASFIDLGIEAIHFGQAELMDGNDPGHRHWAQLLAQVRRHAAAHARRHLVLCDAHVPSGGLLCAGRLLLDFHSFPLRIKEVPARPQEAILEIGFADGIYGRSSGGETPSGWSCEHLPYLVELDNWGVSKHPGEAGQGGIWVWGYDEIDWFAHQSPDYRQAWLRYAWGWVPAHDPAGHLQLPGSRTMVSPLDHRRWYFAEHASPAIPDGSGEEDTIRALWAATTGGR